MKKYLLVVVLTGLFFSARSQDEHQYLDKVSSLDSILTNLYGVISGEKGEERNWELFHYLFAPDAKLIPSWNNEEGKRVHRFITPAEYVEQSGPWLMENGFYEIEISRKVDTFGPVVQAFSTYESFHSKNDTEPFMRGINSIQLLNDGDRWWVMNIFWSQESEENPIPQKYLPNR